MVRSSLRRASLLLAGALVLANTLIAQSPAAATPTLSRSDAAAGWLARQLVDGERFEVTFDGVSYPDQGLTIDAILAFAATKTADDYAARATSWLATPGILTGYIGDGVGEAYAGATAKLSLVAQVRGANPASFGGVDLLAQLNSLLTPAGRFADRSAWGDFSNSFGQSLALLSLDRTAAGAPASAVSYLAASRCADGGYPVYFEQAECVSDPDATALAVQALLAVDADTDAEPGLQWLVVAQTADGGFAGNGVVNANSTGLAVQALLAGGRLIPAARGWLFLHGLQVGCSGAVADRGAVNFTTGAFDPSTATRATAQATLGLSGVGLAGLSSAGSSTGASTLYCH